MLALVVAGGDLLLSERVRQAARAADLVVAADSGVQHLAALGRQADVVLGDYDSSARPAVAAGGPDVLVYPAAKDETDLHLAVRQAAARGATQVRLIAALRGPRLDHAAANLLLLSADEFARIDLRAIDGEDELRAVRSHAEIEGAADDLVSLIPLTSRCSGVSTAGLAYPLLDATLARGATRGVSNVLLGAAGTVTLAHGVLLLVHRHGGDPNVLRSETPLPRPLP